MKPYRVKRGGKYIGSFIVVHGGQRVNLGTKDANEARRRAVLLAKGKSWEGRDVADDVRAALEGAPPAAAAVPERQLEQAMPAAVPPPAAGAAVPPPAPAQTVADAVNATAAGIAGDVQSALSDAGFDLGAFIGDQLSDDDMGTLAEVGTGYAASGIVWLADRWVEPPDLPPKLAKVKTLIGRLGRAELAKLKTGLENLSPRWVLGILLGVTTLVQTVLAFRQLKAPPQTQEPSPDLRAVS